MDMLGIENLAIGVITRAAKDMTALEEIISLYDQGDTDLAVSRSRAAFNISMSKRGCLIKLAEVNKFLHNDNWCYYVLSITSDFDRESFIRTFKIMREKCI